MKLGRSSQRALGVGSALLLGACAVALPSPTASDTARVARRWPHVTTADLDAGRTLYAERCSRCHELYAPDSYGAAAWERNVRAMRERSRLSDAEHSFIVQYLVSVASRNEPPGVHASEHGS
jgi:cytochrome c5